MPTGKQLWDELERLEMEKVTVLDNAKEEDLRRALGYGYDKPGPVAAIHRAMVKRAMRRRNFEVPEQLQ